MHYLDIQAELKKQGISQKMIAEALGVNQMTVSRVIRGLLVSDRTMRYIAKLLELPVQNVFPDYYLSPPKRQTSKAFGPAPTNKVVEMLSAVNG